MKKQPRKKEIEIVSVITVTEDLLGDCKTSAEFINKATKAGKNIAESIRKHVLYSEDGVCVKSARVTVRSMTQLQLKEMEAYTGYVLSCIEVWEAGGGKSRQAMTPDKWYKAGKPATHE